MNLETNSQRLGRPHANHHLVNKRKESKEERRLSLPRNQHTLSDIKPTCSMSTPLSNNKKSIDVSEQWHFLREMEQAREDMADIRKNMAGLVEQMNSISTDLSASEERVYQVEQEVTTAEEFNVNLQVILEKAKKSQRQSDVFAHQAIKNIYSDLALVIYENNQLQGRLASIEQHQQHQENSVNDILKRMQEYTHMLEQAQSTIHMLQEPRFVTPSIVFTSNYSSTSRRSSVTSLYHYDDDDDDNHSVISSSTFTTATTTGTRRPAYVQSPPLGPNIKSQQGIRMLFEHTF